jgi:hypothetical protein
LASQNQGRNDERLTAVESMCAGLVAPAVLVSAFLSSQVGRLWTFSDLVTESDCVVIGRGGDVRDTGRKATHPELRPDLPVVELEMDVHVLAVLKGAATVDAADTPLFLVLHHYRIDTEEWRRQHPAAPGQPPPSLLNVGEELRLKSPDQTYLFFLKRGRLGWEPTTGHTFPARSIFPLGGGKRIAPTPDQSPITNRAASPTNCVSDASVERRNW